MTEQEQNGANQNVKRWTAKRKAALILDLIKGRTTKPVIPRSGNGLVFTGKR